MMRFKTYLAPSPIHGIGVFAAEPIPSGSIVFEEDDLFTLQIPAERVPTLPPMQQEFIRMYAYLEGATYKLSVDNDRFTNHSDEPNTETPFGVPYLYALRDIQVGEEITARYSDFCDNGTDI